MKNPTENDRKPDECAGCAVDVGSALQTAVSQAIQAAIAAHIEEYSKHFPEQAWGKGALHARLLPAVMAVMPNNKLSNAGPSAPDPKDGASPGVAL